MFILRVSSEGVAPDSEDEGVCEDSDAYEESFIDDQSDSAIGSGQTDSKLDMMAIYRYMKIFWFSLATFNFM